MGAATSTSFDAMLKKYMPYSLLEEEVIKRDYFLQKVAKDNSWKGGQLQVPFRGGSASSIKYGGLVDAADIADDKFVLATIDDYKEVWGSMQFHDSDLARHGSLEASFVKLLPDALESFVSNMKSAVSGALLNGAKLDVATGAGESDGEIPVSYPEKFEIGMKVEIADTGSARRDSGLTGGQDDFFVIGIDMNNKKIKVSDTRGGSALDVSSIVSSGDDIYRQGSLNGNAVQTSSAGPLTSLHDQLASSVATIHGQTKANYPILQAFNKDGSSMAVNSATDANRVLTQIFDAQTEVRRRGKGNPTDCLVSYSVLAGAMKELEGSRQFQADVSKANKYGWTEIDVVGVKGSLKLVGIPELDEGNAYILDWDSMKLHSNGFFERRTSPDGKQFYETRATTGYKYIVDTRFFGDLVVSKPSHNGIITGISL